jgi:hypothetical protein
MYYMLSFIAGLCFSPILGWQIARRVMIHRAKNLTLEAMSARLEKLREAHDFDRPDEDRVDAGPAAEQSSLFPARPGSMTLDHLTERKSAKGVARGQD